MTIIYKRRLRRRLFVVRNSLGSPSEDVQRCREGPIHSDAVYKAGMMIAALGEDKRTAPAICRSPS
jgi:hypothetical protein